MVLVLWVVSDPEAALGSTPAILTRHSERSEESDARFFYACGGLLAMTGNAGASPQTPRITERTGALPRTPGWEGKGLRTRTRGLTFRVCLRIGASKFELLASPQLEDEGALQDFQAVLKLYAPGAVRQQASICMQAEVAVV